MRNPFKATHFDIPFEAEHMSKVLPTMIALMLYLMTMIWAGGVLVGGMAHKWQSDLEGSMTVQIATRTDLPAKDQQKVVENIQSLLSHTKGITKVSVLSSTGVLKTLEPWLGKGFSFDGLPVPILFSVSLRGHVDIPSLQKKLESMVPHVVISDHRFWLIRANVLANLIEIGFFVAGLLFMLIFALMVVYGVYSSLSAHKNVVNVLHTVGAHDNYIVDQFVSYIVRVVTRASLVGFVLALLTIALIFLGVFLSGVSVSIGFFIMLHGVGWLLLLPVITILVAWGTSARCVRQRLSSYYV